MLIFWICAMGETTTTGDSFAARRIIAQPAAPARCVTPSHCQNSMKRLRFNQAPSECASA
jgi:hypothetical protein